MASMLARMCRLPSCRSSRNSNPRVGAIAQKVGIGPETDMPVGGRGGRLRLALCLALRLALGLALGLAPGGRTACRGSLLGRARGRRGGQFSQLGQDLGGNTAVGRALAGGLVQHRFDVIERGQGEIDEIGSGAQTAVAHGVEGGLDVVGEGGHVVEAEHRSRALDGMQRTERAAHQFGVRRGLAEGQQGRLQLHQALARFLLESLLVLIDRLHGHNGFLLPELLPEPLPEPPPELLLELHLPAPGRLRRAAETSRSRSRATPP
jgi:hypothetical protein